MISIVVAHSANRVIGREGGLPWRLPTDMRHFRELTSGGTVLMGRRTYESIPDAFRPLPDRRNLVLSGDPAFAAPGAEVYRELSEALHVCGRDCFVIGGAVTYAELLPACERVHATEIEAEIDGDVLFPELAPDEWRCCSEEGPVFENGLSFRFRSYERVGGAK
ncbi:MAG TPA: dihydrofolate reductase [Solirubrobacteraceae bacterium]